MSDAPDTPAAFDFQTLDQRRHEVGRDIAAAGRLLGDFQLNSGMHTDYFLDKHLFLTRPTILRRLASIMCPLIPRDIDRLAGCEDGAAVLATALALESGLSVVTLAKQGTQFAVHGELHPGERALLVEDVVASGQRATSAVLALREHGARADAVLAVIDRRHGGGPRLDAANAPLTALFTAEEIISGTSPGGQT